MNKSKIEWCDYTWNPVTGCLHGCDYCYARRIAERFSERLEDGSIAIPDGGLADIGDTNIPYPYGFAPTFHRYRLGEPAQKTKGKKIFVCSMADLFGDWVPDEWIEEVFKACEKAPQHTYMFLSKNPKRYKQLYNKGYITSKMPHYFGFTIENQGSYLARAAETTAYPWMNLFLSIEPLQKQIELHPFTLRCIEWVIIGAQTGPGAVPPKPEWVQSILDQCRTAGVPVFLKNNLNWPEKIQEFPAKMEGSK